MVTKSRLKLIKSLSRKKNREEHQLFVVEGYKSIQELAQTSLELEQTLVTDGNHHLDHLNVELISKKDMDQISMMKTAPGYLAIFRIPKTTIFPDKELVVALDDIKDPGNLGTIIRMCDWFNVRHILCSLETVDAYNPKCVQASMASLGRVHIHYVDLKEHLNKQDLPVYATAMDAPSVYETPLPNSGILLMGNESTGVSQDLLEIGITISIPSYGSSTTTESLNVATATSILLAEWRRSTTEK